MTNGIANIEFAHGIGIVRIEGQPPSGNHMYEGYGSNRRKRASVTEYQQTVTFWVRQLMAAGYRPGVSIVVNYWFHLGRDIDCTNVMKVVEDGIAEALCPGIDPPGCCRRYDTRFLPRAQHKKIGVKAPYVEIELMNLTNIL